jgi:hypothetical protein
MAKYRHSSSASLELTALKATQLAELRVGHDPLDAPAQVSARHAPRQDGRTSTRLSATLTCAFRRCESEAVRGNAARLRSMEGGSVDELLDVTVERPVLDQLQVEVGRTLEDPVQPGLTGDDREERHLQAVD